MLRIPNDELPLTADCRLVNGSDNSKGAPPSLAVRAIWEYQVQISSYKYQHPKRSLVVVGGKDAGIDIMMMRPAFMVLTILGLFIHQYVS